MKTFDEVYSLVQVMNEESHTYAWPYWIKAESEDDDDLRDEASQEQLFYFRESFYALPVLDRQSIWLHLEQNPDFADEFRDFYGSYYYDKKMNPEDIVYRLYKRARIRRQIPDRKSVQNNEPDRIADILEEAAREIEKLRRDND
jgi:hypothetical protein